MTDNEQHDFETTLNYIKVMLGAPAVEVNLTDTEISQCVDAAAEEIHKRLVKYGKCMSASYMENKLREGALARAKYLSGKRKFLVFHGGPEHDGWDMMCDGSNDWRSFKTFLTLEGK